jgi:baseplate J-like protein
MHYVYPRKIMSNSQPEEVIQIQPDEEIATIRDRLQWAQASRVILVVPLKNKAMRDKMNLKLLQRTAIDQAMQVALVAHHRDTVRLAKEIGLPVFWTTNSIIGRRNWSGAAKPVFVPDEDGDEVKVIPPTEWSLRHNYRVVRAIVFGVVLLLLTGFAFMLAPSAQITLAPVTQEASVKIEITANPTAKTINSALGQIPAHVEEIQLDGTEQIPPIAKKDVPDARATGTVIFTSKADQAVKIPKGTIVSTSGGVPIRFATTKDADLPARGRVEIEIAAVEPGPNGNVARFTINTAEGPFALAVNVVNQNPAAGGNVKRVPVVSEEDKRRLGEVLTQRLRQEAVTKFQAKLAEGEFVAPESVRVTLDSTTFDKFVDEPTDLLTLSAHATARGTIVDGANANIVAFKQLESKLREGFVLLPTTVQYIPGQVLGVDQDTVRFEITAKGRAAAGIDEANIANSLRGMTIKQAEDWLDENLTLQRDPVVTLKPDWLSLGRLPFFNFRMSVEVVQ